MSRYVAPSNATHKVALRESWNFVQLDSHTTSFDFETESEYRRFGANGANMDSLVEDVIATGRDGKPNFRGTKWTVRFRSKTQFGDFECDIFSFTSLPLDELEAIVSCENQGSNLN